MYFDSQMKVMTCKAVGRLAEARPIREAGGWKVGTPPAY